MDALWTVQDVARHLSVSRAWVYEKAALGELPVVHVGALRRFQPSAIATWVARHTKGRS
ncbi:MAG TPA: helix-turn-helix domain-containing protein [Myxococcaceae bacterium]|nr:helix-turn-helix domain-containing protein [Myxococcaceae bacterium]